MTRTNIITRAMQFAYERHDGQMRDDGVPFITHPAKVAQIVSQVTNDENIIAAAWLHDTIEDTNTTHEELVKEFNKDIADLVLEVTKDKTHPETTFPNLHTQRGVMLKFADRLSNLADMEGWSQRKKDWYATTKSRFW